MMDTTEQQAGFTLIEVLVSLALLAVLSLYTLQALRLQGAMDKAILRIERQLEIRSAQELLQDEISAMQPAFLPDQQGQQQLLFEGTNDTLSFAVLSDGSRFEGGLYRMTLFVNTDKTLMAQFAALSHNSNAQPIEIAVLSHLAALSITYRGDDAGAVWQEKWTVTNTLPQQIRLMIDVDDTVPRVGGQKNFVVLSRVALTL